MIPWSDQLSKPLFRRSGLGPQRLAALAKVGLVTSLDLLLTPPIAYRDRREVVNLSDAEDQKEIVFIGRVINTAQGISAKGRSWYRVDVIDGDDKAFLWWFSQIQYFSSLTHKGDTLVIAGKVVLNDVGIPSLSHPDICQPEKSLTEFLGIKPLYRIIPGMPLATYKRVLGEIFRELPQIPPVLPPEWTAAQKLPEPLELINIIHNPPPNPGVLPPVRGSRAFHRLVTYELMFWRLLIILEKAQRKDKSFSRKIKIDPAVGEKFLSLLDFEPTPEQKRVTAEFIADLSAPEPLNRLLQGEVGSGKTVVAGTVATMVLAQNKQVAILAPTDLLARQHLDFLGPKFTALGFSAALLTGSLPAKERQRVLAGLKSGDIKAVIGTQAILTGQVEFMDLGLAVIDEQQRFGVKQRMALARRAPGLDLMSMSATPIPRSLAHILYGDLEISTIKGTIPGRLPTRTEIYDTRDQEKVYRLFLDLIRQGEQGFIVCPRIGTPEEDEPKGADPSQMENYVGIGFNEYALPPDALPPPVTPSRSLWFIEKTIKQLAPDLTYGILHGRQDIGHRQKVMADFRAKRISILVATTIIEVGVDVPEANLMLVEGADIFGLSQLHQLRGRIGRGGGRGLFLALSSPQATDNAVARLKALNEFYDGFKLAEMDLLIRGPGEELGLKQSGWPTFKFVKLPKDLAYLPKALELADDFWPQLSKWPELEDRLKSLAKELSVLLPEENAIEA
jgi:ATP-dependent DNA helicase RecG